ncbi:hypothetical protein MUP05_08255 [Candidatus Bathyarchaeota archaeon]|nr:hypothetical protein [Candidatus Bathyarchaeota archaeon]
MTTDADIQALAAKFGSIEDRAARLTESISSDPFGVRDRTPRLRTLVETYQGAFQNFQNISRGASVTLDYLEISSLPSARASDGSPKFSDRFEYLALLDKLAINCETALGYLRALASPIPLEDKDRLDSLRQQIGPLEQFNENLFKHITTAIEEYEKGHYLASALSAGKAVVYVLEQLPGKTDEDKANELVKLRLLDEKMKPNFLKGARRARIYFTHDISAIPLPQDALSLVSDACDLSLKLVRVRQS